jgi:hypothetical protein
MFRVNRPDKPEQDERLSIAPLDDLMFGKRKKV